MTSSPESSSPKTSTPEPAAQAMSHRPSPGPPLLEVRGVTQRFAQAGQVVQALGEVHFLVEEGEFVTLVGPSGGGKSSLLHIIAGLQRPSSGQVLFRGEPIQEPHPEVGIVFQRTNLMPWRTALENVLLPLEVRPGGLQPGDRRRAQELLALVGLEGFEDAYPQQLSGGMAQRVVLARTLIQQPRLLLLDEPFGALDALTRERLNLELLRLHALQGQSMLMVTHSIDEAVFLADRVLVMSERPGRLQGEVRVDLPRPRRLDMTGSEAFGQLTLQVRRCLGMLG